MSARAHHHPCSVCGAKVECAGTQERNHDGWPETVCGSYHLSGGSRADVRCESCETLKQCDDCGEYAPTTAVEDADDASGYRGTVELCKACQTERHA